MIHTRLIPPDILLSSAIKNNVIHGSYSPANVTETAPIVIIDKFDNIVFPKDDRVRTYYRILIYDEYDDVCGGPLTIIIYKQLISDSIYWYFYPIEDINEKPIGPFKSFEDAASNIDILLCDMINDHKVRYRVMNEMYETPKEEILVSPIYNTTIQSIENIEHITRSQIDYQSRLKKIKK